MLLSKGIQILKLNYFFFLIQVNRDEEVLLHKCELKVHTSVFQTTLKK